MEPPEPTSAKFKLWRWLLLLSVITVTLGDFVWWKSRSERLQFVEPIWSDSLPGHEHDAAIGQRRRVGEVWSLSCSSGFTLFGRGRSREFEARYPVFTPANSFQRTASEKLLAELRDAATDFTKHDWSYWWDSIKAPSVFNRSGLRVSCDVIFVSDQAVSLRQTVWDCEGGAHESYGSSGRNIVDRDGELHEVQLVELFHGADWKDAVTDFCFADLSRQAASFLVSSKDNRVRGILMTHISQNGFAITPDGLHCYFPPHMLKPNSGRELTVFLPFEKLAGHLRPDGPHRLFQTKVSE